MNPNLNRLQPYPFHRLRQLLEGVPANAHFAPIAMHIGEPQHDTPEFIKQALIAGLKGLAHYPTTQGSETLRTAIARWLMRRYGVEHVDPETQVLPVNGSREALFAFAQAVVDTGRNRPLVIMPNPFYQIYEGAALLAGAAPYFINLLPGHGYAMDFSSVGEQVWERAQLIYVCSPNNPTGSVLTLAAWKQLFELSERHAVVIASDECYSEIYSEEHQAPMGGLQAARQLGRHGFKNLVVFGSLSKRSNLPGMRSGFVAGDAEILRKFFLYRTYHGGAMAPAIQDASVVAWNDEAHVIENRRMYREKFAKVVPALQSAIPVVIPEAAFYLWARTPMPDTEFARRAYRDYNLTVLPGSFLGREADGVNPGAGFVRIALVAPLEQCLQAAQRINDMLSKG
ncbi:MAG: succinyldiaminopimelate transaminase [Burkholderiales bacterium]